MADGGRVQKHALEDAGRILDATDGEVFRGTAAAALAEFARRELTGEFKTPAGHVVLTLHGVVRNRNSMAGTTRRLRDAGLQAFALDYACTHRPVAYHGEALRELLDHLPHATRIDIVGHSMGGLVARACLGVKPDPRIKRIVMVGTPNQGAENADFFAEWKWYQGVFGPAGQDLKTDRIAERLPGIPAGVEVGVVAGGLGDKLGGRGINVFRPRDNDGIVSVEMAKLPGMKDFVVMPYYHSVLPWSKRVQEATVRFLETGAFAEPAKP